MDFLHNDFYHDNTLDDFRNVIKNFKYVFSGSYNPIHSGHLEIANYVNDLDDYDNVLFHIPNHPQDKTPLSEDDIQARFEAFTNLGRTCVSTSLRTYVGMSSLFAGMTFIVGVDTISRVIDPKYYHKSIREIHRAFRTIHSYNCDFLVFPRYIDGKIIHLEDIKMSSTLSKLCKSPIDFNPINISSTEIRNSQ